MKAETIVRKFAELQGWSNETVRKLLYQFIASKDLEGDLEAFLRNRAHDGEDGCEGRSIRIKAECHSDDRVFVVEFDAQPWFHQASDEDIVELARCSWGGDYPADAVAEFMEELDKEVGGVFEYVRHHQEQGFECHVNADSAMKWLRRHRPDVADAIEHADETKS